MTGVKRTVVLHKRPDYHSFGIYIGEDVPSGIYIVTIEPHSPAAEVNIQPGDRVLAFNGQLVSSLSKNPKEMLIQTAANNHTLTLTIQSTNILEDIDIVPPNHYSHDTYRYPSKHSKNIDQDLERYLKSIFSDDNLHIIRSSSGNDNEYLLKSEKSTVRSHRPRKRRPHTTEEKPTVTNNAPKEDTRPVSQVRSIPSMGTSHAILRRSQSNSKDTGLNEQQEDRILPNNQSAPVDNRSVATNSTANHTPEPPPPTKPPLGSISQLVDARVNPNQNQQPPLSSTSQLVDARVNPNQNQQPPPPTKPPLGSISQLVDARVNPNQNQQPPPPTKPPLGSISQLVDARVNPNQNQQPPLSSTSQLVDARVNPNQNQQPPPPTKPPLGSISQLVDARVNPNQNQQPPLSSTSQLVDARVNPNQNQQPPPPTKPPLGSISQLVDARVNPNQNQQPPPPTKPPLGSISQLVDARVNPNQNRQPPLINGEGLHEVRLHRLPDFEGFGFHVQYNRIYYVIQRIEPNGPADRSGLRNNDVVRLVNHQSTAAMPHEQFVEIINASTEVIFLVQPYDDYLRANPYVPPIANNDQPVTVTKTETEKRPNILSKALTKLKSR